MFICFRSFVITKFSTQRLNSQNDPIVWDLSKDQEFTCSELCPSFINLTGTSEEKKMIKISGDEGSVITFFDNIMLNGSFDINKITANIILIGKNIINGKYNFCGIRILSKEGEEGILTVNNSLIDDGAGIGSMESCEEIQIEGGNIEAIGGENSAGLGAGSKGQINVININNGTFNGAGGHYGAGIGGGYDFKKIHHV